jgi:hypothetical protein
MAKAESEHAMRFGRTNDDELLDSLSTAQIVALDKKVRMAAEQKVQYKEDFSNAVVFSKLHPEYLVCRQNAGQMMHYFDSRGITHVDVPMLEEGGWPLLLHSDTIYEGGGPLFAHFARGWHNAACACEFRLRQKSDWRNIRITLIPRLRPNKTGA